VTRSKGDAPWGLARLLARSWQVRAAAAMTFAMLVIITLSSSVADSLQLSSSQRADAALGAFDAAAQVPGSLPVGLETDDLDASLESAVRSAGATEVAIEHVFPGLQSDDGVETTFTLREFDDDPGRIANLEITSGTWPTQAGEANVSSSVAEQYPVGSSISFFNGLLAFTVVGTHVDDYARDARDFVVPIGTWSGLARLDTSAAALLDQSGNCIVLWTSSGDPQAARPALVAAAQSAAAGTETTDFDATSVEIESRAAIESQTAPPNVPLAALALLGPALSGALGGLLAGLMVGRMRRSLWEVGIPFARSRASALLAVSVPVVLAALLGSGVGQVLGFALRPLLDSLSGRALGPPTDPLPSMTGVALAAAGVLLGFAGSQRIRRQAAPTPARRSVPVAGVTVGSVLGSLGIFVGGGASEVSTLSLCALLIAAGIIVGTAPLVVALTTRAKPGSLAATIVIRRISASTQPVSISIAIIAGLQVLGITLALLLSSTLDDINASTESQVPPGQIVLESDPLSGPEEIDAVRLEFESRLGLGQPISMSTVEAGTSRQDGATRVVESVDDVQELLSLQLSPAQREVLEHGGTLLTKLPEAEEVTFPSDEGFAGATIPAINVTGVDASFRNIDGLMLLDGAESAELPVSAPSYVYTDATTDQAQEAESTLISMGINPDRVQVFREPDVLQAPLRISAITALLALAGGALLILVGNSDVRALRPSLSGLRAIGVPTRLLRRVVAGRVVVTAALSVTIALIAASIGVAAALALARLTIPLTLPLLPTGFAVISLFMAAGVVAWLSSRRLRASEWRG